VSYLQARRIRKARRRKQRRTARLRVVLLAFVGLIGAMVVLAGLALNHEIKKVAQETAHLNIKTLGQNTAIYDRYGHLLGIVAGEQNRTLVSSSSRRRSRSKTSASTSTTASTTCAWRVRPCTISSVPEDCRAPRRSPCS